MKLKVLLLCGAFLVAAPDTAVAKISAYRLTVDGPGMTSTGVIRDIRLVERTSSALLFTSVKARMVQPEFPGVSYVLTYRFGVSDEDGTRTAAINQALHPFASGGPVVFTALRQGLDTTYGPVRFVHGWFKVPDGILRALQRAGLPTAAPEPETAPKTELQTERRSSSLVDGTFGMWPWMLGMGALLVAIKAVAWVSMAASVRRNRKP